ncbi:amidohydrolase family protein [Enterococcus casseliflavus]|uniref:amidohydrolase family protein n=1 Tax=Enterococcus casseliflavus TaxID=37734 RepID=UPI003D1402E9
MFSLYHFSLLLFAERIAYMNQVGVDVQLISYGNNNPQDLPAEYAVEMTRLANDEMAEKIALYPDRFYGLASLPVADVSAAVAELRRAVTELGFKGAQLTGTFQGRFFDEAEFFPIFEEAARLDVPIALHPGEVSPAVIQHYYEGEWSDQVTNVLAGHGFGWHADIGIEVMRLIVSGIFDKLPNLKIISGHFGELIPYFLDRLNETLPTNLTGLKNSFAEYYRDHIYVSPSGMFYDSPFDLCLKVLKPDHLLWSMDYPYMKRENTRQYLENFQLTDNQKEQIAHLNAEKLLKL